MGRIVVGVDGSDGGRAACTWALSQAAATGATVEVVRAYDTGLAWIDVGTEYADAMARAAEEQARRDLDGVVAELAAAVAVPVEAVVASGPPADVLVDRARGADLLVVGTRGRGGFAGLLLGSVSQRCVERAPCPVVVVPRPAPQS